MQRSKNNCEKDVENTVCNKRSENNVMYVQYINIAHARMYPALKRFSLTPCNCQCFSKMKLGSDLTHTQKTSSWIVKVKLSFCYILYSTCRNQKRGVLTFKSLLDEKQQPCFYCEGSIWSLLSFWCWYFFTEELAKIKTLTIKFSFC